MKLSQSRAKVWLATTLLLLNLLVSVSASAFVKDGHGGMDGGGGEPIRPPVLSHEDSPNLCIPSLFSEKDCEEVEWTESERWDSVN